MKKENRRKFHRIAFNDLANVKFADGECDCAQIKNLSLTGMFVSCRRKNPPKGLCHIRFVKKNNPENIYLEIRGEYVWKNNDGMGVKFTNINPDNYMSLISTLINNAKLLSVILYQIPTSCPYEVTK